MDGRLKEKYKIGYTKRNKINSKRINGIHSFIDD